MHQTLSELKQKICTLDSAKSTPMSRYTQAVFVFMVIVNRPSQTYMVINILIWVTMLHV